MDEVWQACLPHLDLTDLSGHAAWTPQVHAALKERLTELASIFLGHATAGGAGKPPLLSRDDFELLLRECRLLSGAGAAADEALDEKVALVWEQLAKRAGAAGGEVPMDAGDPPQLLLNMPRFLGALVRLAFEPDKAVAPEWLPPPPTEQLVAMIDGAMRPRARRDAAYVFRLELAADTARQKLLSAFEAPLRQLFARVVANSVIHAPKGQRQSAALRNQLSAAPRATPAAFVAMLREAGLLASRSVQAASAVTGDALAKRSFTVELTEEQAAGVYVEAIGARAALPERSAADRNGEWADLDFEGFTEALARAARQLYREVPGMLDADSLAGVIKTVLHHESASASVLATTYIGGPDRFNAWRDAAPLVGETQADHDAWLRAWGAVDLSAIDGFPLWERGVHDKLHEAFAELIGICAPRLAPHGALKQTPRATVRSPAPAPHSYLMDLPLNTARLSALTLPLSFPLSLAVAWRRFVLLEDSEPQLHGGRKDDGPRGVGCRLPRLPPAHAHLPTAEDGQHLP